MERGDTKEKRRAKMLNATRRCWSELRGTPKRAQEMPEKKVSEECVTCC